MRVHGRGKRWLLLRRWKRIRGSKRAELQALFAANRRLFKAFVLREQLDRLWTYRTRPGVLNFLMGWFKALRWQRLPETEQLGDFLAWSSRSIRQSKPCSVARVAWGMKRDAAPELNGPPPTPVGPLETWRAF